MDRREFLSAAAAASMLGMGSSGLAAPATAPSSQPVFGLDSPPVLQCPAPDGVTVCWAVNGPSAGWVEYGDTEKLGRRAMAAQRGLVAYEDRFFTVRLSGLRPGEAVYYRVLAAPVTFQSAYKIIRGEAVASPIYRYVPPTSAADTASIAVINDTHEQIPTMSAITADLAKSPADVTVWNGDVFNDIRSTGQIVQNVLRPAGAA